ncbi:Sterol O-acyltransferase 2 (Sterol-ester synthase 2) [Balamuthia mandrillaris]
MSSKSTKRKLAAGGGGDAQPPPTTEAANNSSPPTKAKVRLRDVKFQPRLSLLSNFANLTSQDLSGFKNLAIVLTLMVVVTELTNKYYESEGSKLMETFLLFLAAKNIPIMLGLYAALLVLGSSVVILHKMVMRGWLSIRLSEVIHYIIIAFMFLLPIYTLTTQRVPPPQSAFALFQMVIITMKMHSYLYQNNGYYLRQIMQGNAKKKDDTTDEGEDEFDWLGDEQEWEQSIGADVVNEHVKYPENVTFSNFFVFIFMPTLVYMANFPRTRSIRKGFVLQTLVSIAGLVAAIYIAVAHFILPILSKANELAFFHLLAQLSIPVMLTYMLVFFFVFEVILNGFAEVTRFADRHFYDDWWNSTSYDEFARKWNRPVHGWLLRHVYNRRLRGGHGKSSALWITFIFSAVLHELLMAVAFRVIAIWIFSLMMLELGFIYALRAFRGTNLGNLLFWCTMFLGTPLLALLYAREYYIQEVINHL